MMTEAKQKQFMRAFVEKIEIYREKTKDGVWIRSITFNFPIPVESGYVKEFPLESSSTIEPVLKLSKLPNLQHIDIDLDLDELDVNSTEMKTKIKKQSRNTQINWRKFPK